MDEIVLNYHVTEKCNYSCKYCFAKYGLEREYDSELHHNLAAVEELLKVIYDYFCSNYDTRKIRLNLAGGEPLLLPSIKRIIGISKYIGYMLSVITNSTCLTKKFIEEYALYFSVVGLSIDSFCDETNINIGRSLRSNRTISSEDVFAKIRLLREINNNIHIKINTVVSQFNYNEIIYPHISRIKPDKWKIFKELGSISSSVNDGQFDHFVDGNINNVDCPVFVENNDDMTNSYLMIDPLGRFYQNVDGKASYIYSDRILQVGVANALKQVTFILNKFKNRYVSIGEKHNKALHSDGNSASLHCRRLHEKYNPQNEADGLAGPLMKIRVNPPAA